MQLLGFNKLCELEDFSDPDLIHTMRDVFQHEIRHFTPAFPQGAEYRKYWEVAMSIRALRHHSVLRPDALILGVGAGTEVTSFYLANHVRQIFATDLYLDPGAWGRYAPGFMLAEPEKVAPYPYDTRRLVVQHMDGRRLAYPDDTFDGIFSSGSIEHFGTFQDIAHAAYEMGRVLKPGGVLTISTEFRISGRVSGVGLYGMKLFGAAELQRYIVEASGLELVDALDTGISPATMATKYPFRKFAADMHKQTKGQGKYPRVGEIVFSKYPHLVLAQRSYVHGSVHLALRKTDHYPAHANAWANPRAGSDTDGDRLKATQSTSIARLFNKGQSLTTKVFWALYLNAEERLRNVRGAKAQ